MKKIDKLNFIKNVKLLLCFLKMKYFNINLTNFIQDLYAKNYKLLMKRNSLSEEMERHTMSMGRETQHNKDVSFPRIYLHV